MREELELDATVENLENVNDFLSQLLQEESYNRKDKQGLEMAVEEIYVNIASYAYAPHVGKVKIKGEAEPDGCNIVLQFVDEGKPFNPLEQDEPDFSIPVEERRVGGLGIFIVKAKMDDVKYEYKDGKNILTIRKKLTKA